MKRPYQTLNSIRLCIVANLEKEIAEDVMIDEPLA